MPRLRRNLAELLLPFLVVGSVSAEDRIPLPSIETVVQRMAQARTGNQALLRAYSVTRNYTLLTKDRREEKGKVQVQISFSPPDAKKFVIQSASGTRFAERAVRQMLEHETDIVKNHDSTEMSLANYDFQLVRQAECSGQPCFVLAITPRRKDTTLLKGHIWVDAATYLLHRTEGTPAKGPSWWLRDSSIIFTYGDVDGMWLQTASESKSNVRFVGQYIMVSRDAEYTLVRRGEASPSPLRVR
jgi:outer membrane lipoprotein-sorting protein